MLHFESDYVEGAHPNVLRALLETNHIPASGYGTDVFTASAKAKIATACQLENAQVSLLVGGTQTNAIVIDAVLRAYEGVIAVDTGHINQYEAGAIEYTGHKVLTLPHEAGKLNAASLREYLVAFFANPNCTHMVLPGMVYISQPTEYGTLYSKEELQALSQVCRDYQLPLFIDGARLGYALAAESNDVTLADIAHYADVFYIGGTKIGALCGEAVVFTKQNEPTNWTRFVKKHGALLAKGRLLGVQFDALFTERLYLTLSRHAVDMAMQIKRSLVAKGYELYVDSPTNQQFAVMTPEQLAQISPFVKVGYGGVLADKRVIVRFVTSWSTTQAQVDALVAVL